MSSVDTPWPASPLHSAQRRFLAEDLVRLRRSDEQRRYAAPQRAAKIDPNPHQIEAVIFALARIREGGCILADEVGLGKTIEAGLVIAQLMAEGARRVLLIAPKPLIGQWRQELFQLFEIDARDTQARDGALDGDGVFLVGRESAGSERGRDALLRAQRFDLCVIDEAHEVFANVYKRFDKLGAYDEESLEARTAGRVREVLQAGQVPVLLLTATPIQNSLAELWGLVQYVDPLGTLLGDLPTFREVFCRAEDRQVMPGQEEELRSRLSGVLQRTLRRQAQPFLEKPFVDRHAKLFEYTMGPAEKALYDDVTRYLLEPSIIAFQGFHQQLLLLGFHRRMASSTAALAASLERVAARLRRKLEGDDSEASERDDLRVVEEDLEDDELAPPLTTAARLRDSGKVGPVFPPEAIRAELARVEGFVLRAMEVREQDSKFRSLLQALAFVMDRAKRGQGAGKLVIFTESLVTQEYLRARLSESRLVTDEEITVFRGSNNSVRAREALRRWREETPRGEGPEPSVEIATRLALVHEFKTRSKVFLSTEAGAKGLNLQFSDTLVNYDLPWNPQRIEQRIGRCHRYGQRHSVTVINFIATDNEAQRLTFDILSQKLELFGTVLSATDEVLHQPEGVGGGVLVTALGAELESELRRIYDRARTVEEVTAELKALRERVGETRRRFEETHAHTASLIESSLDDRVQRVFRLRKESLPQALADFDRDLLALVLSYLEAKGIGVRRETTGEGELLVVEPSSQLPEQLHSGIVAAIGPSGAHRTLHLGHPLVVAAVADARAVSKCSPARVQLPSHAPAELAALRGRRAHLRLVKISMDGFERVELLEPVVVLADGTVLDPKSAHALLRGRFVGPAADTQARIGAELVEDAVEQTLFLLQGGLDEAEQARFERAEQQAARYIDDRLLVLKARRRRQLDKLADAQKQHEAAVGSEARSERERTMVKLQVGVEELDAATTRLEQRDEPTFRAYEAHIHQRRYAPPQVVSLLDMELEIE